LIDLDLWWRRKWAKLERMRSNRQKRPIIHPINHEINLPRENEVDPIHLSQSHEVALLMDRKGRSL
jgi:hypothetical protein